MNQVSQIPPVTLGVPADSLMNLALLGKTALALGLVVACVLLCGWVVRRIGARPLTPGKVLRVVSSTSVGQREKVVIVEVQGQWLVLGVTAQQVSALSQMDAPPSDPQSAAAMLGGGFAERLAAALRRNTPRSDNQSENRS
ncbi:flagellar biosynthetic protein FliO [Pseudomonas brassicacearum]|uniref:flagellar biosynthetic protein FliO n=1 Tax=Pseudomonas brassicacearum TaxID=930166 RepID=UPI000721CD40|nr:flagellar biosynthetic protein FliO [Pseudomonas brassicacearum]ALQ01338.1 Flagellar biosynthesis protein FliQ [Pseudomonas brassicacearum]